MFEYWIWLEPCQLNRTSRDYGVSTWLSRVGREVEGVGIYSGLDLICLYTGYDENNRFETGLYGRYPDLIRWTHREMSQIVDCFHDNGVKAVINLFSVWNHPSATRNKFLEMHPELFLTSRDGEYPASAEINPLKKLREDRMLGITDGKFFPQYFAEQARRVIEDFGFDGLFLADGLQGFRCEPGMNPVPGSAGSLMYGIKRIDFSDNYIDLFSEKYGLNISGRTTQEKNQYILQNHLQEWADFNRENWDSWFKTLREALDGKIFGTLDCYGYPPEYAYTKSGIDYWNLGGKIDYFLVQSFEFAKGIYCRYGYPFTRERFAQTMREASRKLDGVKIFFMLEVLDPHEKWDALSIRPDIVRDEILCYIPLTDGAMVTMDGGITAKMYETVNNFIEKGMKQKKD